MIVVGRRITTTAMIGVFLVVISVVNDYYKEYTNEITVVARVDHRHLTVGKFQKENYHHHFQMVVVVVIL